jgi:DNA polymerase elongation subunit (family B)
MAQVFHCDATCKFDSNRNSAHLQHHINHGIFTAISPEEMHLFPTREKFLPQNLNRIISETVNNGKPLIFLPNTTLEKDDYMTSKDIKFHIYMFGILPCGSKTCVILENVPIYVEIRVPKIYESKKFAAEFNNIMRKYKCNYESHETVYRYPFHGHSVSKVPYIRYNFCTLRDRKKFIDKVNEMNSAFLQNKSHEYDFGFIEIVDDDLSGSDYYYPKIAREFRFRTCDWNVITKYTIRNDLTNCKYTFVVNLSDLKRLTKAQKRGIPQELSAVLNRDNTLVGSWDIETYRTIQNGQPPEETDTDFTIINICVAFFWQHSANSLLRVCILPNTVKDAVKHDGISIMICCGNEERLLTSYVDVLGKMQPDILMAYNGGNFDWPLVRVKLRRAGKLLYLKRALSALKVYQNETEDSVFRWSFKSTEVKINAESKHKLKCIAYFPGLLDVDVMPIFMKMYPSAEIRFAHSLNFFLMKNKLESKEDMPYKRMFKIYERYATYRDAPKACHCGTACEHCDNIVPDIDCIPDCLADNGVDWIYKDELHDDIKDKCCFCGKRQRNYNDMTLVGYYCTIDCVRPQQLCVKRVIIMDKRELGTSSSTTLHDSIYRADGMRVRNCLGGICKKLGYAFGNGKCHKKDSDKDHYPGAWVFQPRKGLNNTHPITGMDFESLYPNIMIAYNFSPDMIVYDEATAQDLISRGYTLNKIGPFTFERGEKKGQVGNKILTASGYSVRHNGVMNATDTHIINRYIKKVTYKCNDGRTKTFEYPIDKKFEIVGITDEIMDAANAIHNIENAASDVQNASELTLVRMLEESNTKYERRVVYEPEYGREALPQERLGIFGVVVHKLFNKRVPIKAEFVRLTKLIERLEAEGKHTHVEIIDGKEVTFDIEYDLRFNLQKTEAKQKAIKILNNTFYGESGNFRSRVYELLVAAGTTTTGQRNIKLVAEFVTAKGFGVQYGDSVTADTPVLCRTLGGEISYKIISEMGADWTRYGDKEISVSDLEVWTEQGWMKINHIIRHRTDKMIYRVLTNSGCVDVTSDHSLLDINANKIKPTDCTVGTELLHHNLPKINTNEYISNNACNKLLLAYKYALLSEHINDVILEMDAETYDLSITITNNTVQNPNSIKAIVPMGVTTDYVYDIETENHHFAAGIGKMIVHNTDSLYLTCPDRYYRKIRKEYEDKVAAISDAALCNNEIIEDNQKALLAAKETYWEQLVKLTMRAMTFLKEEIADFLIRDNGTMRLKMAYEEVGFPTVLCGKKKYYMKPHVDVVNFKSSEIFIKGIDIIKQGQSKLAKKLGRQFMRESLQISNNKTLLELALNSVQKFHDKEWPIDKFVLFAKYKPAKKNVPVQTFVRRMCEMQAIYRHNDTLRALYAPPEPGDKFAYVIVERETEFTLSGKRIELKKGDKMEYLSVYNASQSGPNPLNIDVRYYLNSSILGILARFIVYCPDFQPHEGMFDLSDKEEYKKADQYCVKQAVKYLENYSNKVSGFDPSVLRAAGFARRKVYNRVNKAITSRIYSEYGQAADMLMLDFDPSGDESATRQIIKTIQSESVVNENDNMYVYAKSLISMWKNSEDTSTNEPSASNPILALRPKKQSMYNIHTLSHIYRNSQTGITQSLLQFHKAVSDDIINELYRIVPNMVKTLSKYKKSIVNLITDINTDVRDPDELNMELLNDDEASNIKRVQTLKNRLRAVNYLKTEITVITRVMEEERNISSGICTPGPISVACVQHPPANLVPEYIWN